MHRKKKQVSGMDIKKEIEEDSEILDEIVNDINAMSDTGTTENEDESCDVVTGDNINNMKTELETMSDTGLTENYIGTSDGVAGKGLNKIFKNEVEIETDIGFSEANTSYSLKWADKSHTFQSERDAFQSERDAFQSESCCKHDMNSDYANNSSDEDDFLADNNVKMEEEMYQHDDSFDIEGNGDHAPNLDDNDEVRNDPSRNVQGNLDEGCELKQDGSDNIEEGSDTDKDASDNDMDGSDNDLDYERETDSYNEEEYGDKIGIFIKKERADDYEQEADDRNIEEREENVDYGRRTKKAKDHICNLCKKAFTSNNRLKRHKVQVHPEGGREERPVKEGKYVCLVCDKRFISQSRLRLHTVTHTGEKPFSCDFCGQKFSHPTNKRRHMKTHTGDKPFVCLFCGKSFPVKHYLKDHLVKHTGERPHECKLCCMTFAHRFSLKQHELLKHPGGELNFKDTYEDRPFSCEVCGKKFTQQSSLKIHVRLHTGAKPYKCNDCDASFIRSDSLLRHKFEHSGQRPFQCDMCEKAFTSAYILKQHRNVHTGDRRQQCEHCGVELANKESLARHMLRHTGESPHECTICHRKFIHEQSLKRHKEHPCEERIYECKECDYKNLSESKLKRHMLKHNAQKSLECLICKNRFTYPSNLKRHMKVHEKDHIKRTRKKETIVSIDNVEKFLVDSMKNIETDNLGEIKTKGKKIKGINNEEEVDAVVSFSNQTNEVIHDSDHDIKSEIDNNMKKTLGYVIDDDTIAELRNDEKVKNRAYNASGYVAKIKAQNADDGSEDELNEGVDPKKLEWYTEKLMEYKTTHNYDMRIHPGAKTEYIAMLESENRRLKFHLQNREHSEMFNDRKTRTATKVDIGHTLSYNSLHNHHIPVVESMSYKGHGSIDPTYQGLLEFRHRIESESTHAEAIDMNEYGTFGQQHQDKSQEENATKNKHRLAISTTSTLPVSSCTSSYKIPQSLDCYGTPIESQHSTMSYNSTSFASRPSPSAGRFYAQHNLNSSRNRMLPNEESLESETASVHVHDDMANASRNPTLVQDVFKRQ